MSGDAFCLLGVEPGAGRERVDAAYRDALARADAADEASRLRLAAAYAKLCDPRFRARDRLFGPPPLVDLAEIATALRGLPRKPAGAALWQEVLREGG